MKKGILKIGVLASAVVLLVVLAFLLFSCEEHTHNFAKQEIVKQPTCTEAGIKKVICECGEEEGKSIPPTGHKLSERITVLQATCTKDGAYKIECELCGELIEEGKTESLGHDITYHEAREATCQNVGWEAYEDCKNCDYSTYLEMPRIAHTSSGNADCITAETCTLCGEILKEALGHTEKIVLGKKATCQTEGVSDGKICSVCGVVLVSRRTVPKREHTAEAFGGKAATCTATGISDGVRCAECHYIIVQPTVIPKRCHSYSGSSDTQCNDCGFERGVGKNACIHENQTTQKKISASCDSYGLTQGVTCDDCGEVLVQQEPISAKEHAKETVKGIGATCVLPGLGDGVECADCGAVIKHQELILPDGHVEIDDKRVSPSCESEGLSAGRHCAACQEVTLKQNKIEKSGHDKIAHEGKAATCIESGWLPYYTCSKCSYSSYERLERGNHTEVIDAAVAATCVSEGLSEGRHCSTCGAVTLKQNKIDALGHSFGEWKSVKAGGCADTQSEVRVCKICFCVEGKNGARYHEFKAVCEFTDCTEKRALTVTCEKCGAEGINEYIEPLGHDLVWSVTENGHSKRCEREGCGYYTLSEAHKTAWKSKCEDKTCTDCGYVVSKGEGHKLGASYKSDANYHWIECINIGCDYETNKTPHTNPAAKCTDTNVKCTVCSKYYSPNIAHSMGEWYTVSGGAKRRDCAHCGYYETKF